MFQRRNTNTVKRSEMQHRNIFKIIEVKLLIHRKVSTLEVKIDLLGEYFNVKQFIEQVVIFQHLTLINPNW